MAHPDDPKTDPTHLAPIYCHQPKPEQAEPVRCRVCTRPLKTDASIAAGIGPTCAKKLGALDSESRPPRKRKRVRVDPNQLDLFGFVQEDAGGTLEPTSEPEEGEQPPGAPCGGLCYTMTVKVAITAPGGHPSLQVAIAQGGAPCRGC
jgi:hypothetical protein